MNERKVYYTLSSAMLLSDKTEGESENDKSIQYPGNVDSGHSYTTMSSHGHRYGAPR